VLNQVPRYEDVWERGDIAPLILDLVVDEGERSAACAGRFIPCTHLIDSWVSPRTAWKRWRRERIPATVRNRTPVIQPVAQSLYSLNVILI